MRTYLIFSKEADGIPIAMKLEREGHRAIVYINDRDERAVGNGLVEKAKAESEIITKGGKIREDLASSLISETNPDCIVFDMIGKGVGKVADLIRKERPVVGACFWGEVAELDRPYGVK